MPKASQKKTVLGKGKFLRLVRDGKWEYAERINASSVGAVIALTADGELVLTDQHRAAVGCRVIDLPAGLCGDVKGAEDEDTSVAALRELVEETGFDAQSIEFLTACPTTPGLSSEVVSYFIANGLRKVSSGGGVEHEQIQVQTPRLRGIRRWLENEVRSGKMIDPKVYVGLYFIKTRRP